MQIADLSYCPDTGHFTWPNGVEAGTVTNTGYIHIMVSQKNYLGHRLAWYLTHGEWPPEQIDHINGDRIDNRLCNLRPATNKQNAMNSGMRANNKSGIQGVSWCKSTSKWVCRIRNGAKYENLGRFADIEDARQAIEQAKERFGYSANHGEARWVC